MNTPTIIESASHSIEPIFAVGQRRYRLRRLNGNSDKYGPCEICKQYVSDFFYQTEEIFYRHQSGIRRKGWTYANATNRYGHENCLQSKRHGQFMLKMTEEMGDFDVYQNINQ